MTNNIDNEKETAVTVFADDSIKELLKSGKLEDVQKFVQGEQSSHPVNNSCFAWSKGQIVGKYEIIRKIGKGGMGVIYLARHTQLDTLRALKVLPAENVEDNPVFAERFIREARIASQIRHPNVVEVMDVETERNLNVSYIVMEYVDGGSVRQILKKQSKLNTEQAIVTIQGVASALCIAAEHGIVHRDIKPDNIMFTRRGGIKLADLGIAKKDDEEDNLTKTNVMMGTPAYLSPEQVENPKTVDIRSDIYSLGATFYEMLTGQTPYPGKTSYDILRKIFSDPVPDPRSITPEIPEEISAVVMKMLAKDPGKRYQTPIEFLNALNEIISPLSESDIQGIVQSIINLNGDSNSENTSHSLLSGTLSMTRKKEKRKKIFFRVSCAVLFCVFCVAGVFLSGLFFSNKPSPSVEKERKKQLISQELYTLQIKTTPFATLKLIAESGQVFTYAGNAEGLFNISGLQKGMYEMELFCPDYIPYRQKHAVPSEEIFELPLSPDVKYLGIRGIPGTTIVLTGADDIKQDFIIPAEGFVRIKNLKKGTYHVRIFHKEYFPVERQIVLDDNMTISPGMEKIFKTFTLTSLPGSRVELCQNSQVQYSMQVNSNGKCFMPKVKKGVYELRITARNHKMHNSILHIEKDTAVTIPLSRQFYAVTVYGSPGIRGEIYTGTKKVKMFEIPVSGYCIADELIPGDYVIEFSRPGFVSRKYNVKVRENTSLQINLEEVPVKKVPPVLVENRAVGKVNVYLSTSQNILAYIQKNGLEIQFGNGKWIKAKKFPLVRTVNSGEITIRVRGRGILVPPPRTVQVPFGENIDFLLEIYPQPVTVLFSSNRSDTVFFMDGKGYKSSEPVMVEPFRKYNIKAVSGKQEMKKTIICTAPGENRTVAFSFSRNVHPLQKKYEAGLKLIKEKEYEEGLKVLLPVAREKHIEAMVQVAEIYEKGLGMWFSKKQEALRWYKQAADLGNPVAAAKIGDAIFEKDLDGTALEMLKFYLIAAEARNPQICYRLSRLYRNGYKEIRPDDREALYYLKLAAALEVPEAMYDLGIRYEKGQGVPFNINTALDLMRKSAGKGYDPAITYLEQLNQ